MDIAEEILKKAARKLVVENVCVTTVQGCRLYLGDLGHSQSTYFTLFDGTLAFKMFGFEKAFRIPAFEDQELFHPDEVVRVICFVAKSYAGLNSSFREVQDEIITALRNVSAESDNYNPWRDMSLYEMA